MRQWLYNKMKDYILIKSIVGKQNTNRYFRISDLFLSEYDVSFVKRYFFSLDK